jgi:peptidoglycan/LPS O-acetylase OafA/YrhL
MTQPSLSTQPSTKPPILPLTSVRIVAALYVVLLHCTYWSRGYDVTTWFGRFVRNGYTAVGFFFTLSGYILAHVYLNTHRPFHRRSFWTSRFARIYPLLFASLLFDVPRNLFIGIPHHNAPDNLLGTGLSLFTESILLQAWHGIFRGLNAPSWSLSAEAFFYLLFPFTAFWIWRHKARRAVLAFLALWLCAITAPILVTLWQPAIFTEVPSGSLLQQSVELMPIFRIFEFFAGIALCSIQQSLIGRLPAQTSRRLALPALAAAMLLFATVIQLANHIPLLVMSDGLLLPVYGLAILGLVNLRGSLQTLLSHPILVTLGEASYAVYLLHLPLLFYFQHLFAMATPSEWTLYLATVLALSLASLSLVERPARKAILARAAVRPSVTLNQEMVSPG